MLAFGGSRTFHRIACAIEDAGFEIRDTIMWLYGSGFPKSMNIGISLDKKNGVESKVIGQNQDILVKQAKDLREGHRKIVDSLNAGADERNNGFISVSADVKEPVSEDGKKWKGWGTCLKPSFEPIIVARKPFKGSLVDNVIQYGVGGINIDECRVETQDDLNGGGYSNNTELMQNNIYGEYKKMSPENYKQPSGRFPANIILTYDETDKEEVCSGFPETKNSGSASRYFYCAKASKKDRDEGLEEHNTHPTVKPTELMQYLVRLVTPKGGIVLDPFNGSGSTGKAVMYENKEKDKNYKYIGIELDETYLEISKARLDFVIAQFKPEEPKDKKSWYR